MYKEEIAKVDRHDIASVHGFLDGFTKAKRINATFYILDADKRKVFEEEIKDFDMLWHRSPNFHSIAFGYPDPIEWPNLNIFLVEKLCDKFDLHEVKPGIFSDGFKESH